MYVELPPLNVLAGLFTRDDYNEFGHFPTLHPLAQLRHYLLDVGFDLVIGGDYSRSG